MLEGIHSYAPILIILSAAVAFARVITLMNVATIVSEAVLSAISSKVVILLLINVLLLFVGMIMDTVRQSGNGVYPRAAAGGGGHRGRSHPLRHHHVRELGHRLCDPAHGRQPVCGQQPLKSICVRYRQKGSSLYPGVPDRLAADHFRAPDQHVLAAVRAPGSCPFIVLIIFKEDIPMKKLLALLLSLAMALSLAACGGGETAQQEPGGDAAGETYSFSVGTNTAEDSVNHLLAAKFKELIEDRSDGAVTVTLYENGALGGDAELTESCIAGSVDFIVGMTGSLVNYIPEAALFDLPNVFPDLETAREVLDGPILAGAAGRL